MYVKPASKHYTAPAAILILLIAIDATLVSFNPSSKIHAFRNFLSYVIKPAPDMALRIIGQGKYLSGNIISFVRMREENLYLKNEMVRLANLEGKYKVLKDENNRLKDTLGLKKSFDYSLIAAGVISHDPSVYFKSIILDRGADSGITLNSPVVSFRDSRETLVGRIISVDADTSKVLLITDELSAVPAEIGRTGEDGLVQGRNMFDLTIDYLFRDCKARIGDEVITSGIGEVFPKGLFIGVLQGTNPTKRGYFRQGTVMSGMKLDKLSEVFVLKKNERN